MSSKVSSRQGTWNSRQIADERKIAEDKTKGSLRKPTERTGEMKRIEKTAPTVEAPATPAAPVIDEATLAKMVDEAVEQRLAKMVPPKQKASRILGRFGVKPPTE